MVAGKSRRSWRRNRSGTPALTDPSTWTDYATALAAVQAGHGDGVTYVLTKQDQFAAIDLDHCRDLVTGSVDAWAQLMLEQALHSYAEITPSGNGLRIWGTLPVNRLHRKFSLDTTATNPRSSCSALLNKALPISGSGSATGPQSRQHRYG